MTIVMTGGTGLIGQALGQKLSSKNYNIHLLVRKLQSDVPYPCKMFLWPDVTTEPPQEAFPKKENYGIIHLAGEPVSQWPWTKHRKKKIHSSRVEGAKQLLSIVKNLSTPPQLFLSASAIGIYGERGNETLTETSSIIDQNLFLQTVCKDWEHEVLKASSVCRTLIFRFGNVMSYKKGFLHKQMKLPLLPLILSQNPCWLSWISLEDLSSMLLWAIENQKTEGIYNAVSPKPVPLKTFYTALAKHTKSKAFRIPVPLFLMKLAGGEMTKNLLTSGKVLPEKALSQGFAFQQAELEKVLAESV